MSLNKVRYKWLAPVSDFTTAKGKWCVLVGIDAQSFQNDTNSVIIQDQNGSAIDSFRLRGFGVAADEIIVGLPRRMLIPPGGKVIVGVGANLMQIIECASLEDALAIL